MKRGITGARNRITGANFELHLEMQCNFNKILHIKMPLGCRRVGKNRLIPVKTAFDYTLIKDRTAVFIDCKTYDKETLTYSDLTTHQVNALYRIQENGCLAGYLVWHRPVNKVVFYGAYKLFNLRPRESLKIEDGLPLGPLEKITLSLLF